MVLWFRVGAAQGRQRETGPMAERGVVDWRGLADGAARATGADPALDAALAAAFGVAAAPFTGSVEDAEALAAAALPGWKLHLGFDVTGVFPYVRLSNNGSRVEAGASALPLAIVRAVIQAMVANPAGPPQNPASPGPSAPPAA
jgi:hypothetical protein